MSMRRDASRKATPFLRLRHRAEFLAVAKGARSNSDTLGIQVRARSDKADPAPRFGLTVTKKVAPRAVDRNRMRRRLREALRLGAALSAAVDHDYVIVGRRPLLTIGFEGLCVALATQLNAATERNARRRTAT